VYAKCRPGLKVEVLLQRFNKGKLRNGAKTFLDQNFSLFIVNFKKLGLGAPLRRVALLCNHPNIGSGVLDLRYAIRKSLEFLKVFQKVLHC